MAVQSRIATELFSSADFEAWFVRFAAELRANGARVWGTYPRSFVIGDSPDDMREARLWGTKLRPAKQAGV